MATSKHTHVCAQCSPTSVGLAQASPNDVEKLLPCLYTMASPHTGVHVLAFIHNHIVHSGS